MSGPGTAVARQGRFDVAKVAESLEQISQQYSLQASEAKNRFEQCFAIARGMQALRSAITTDVLAEIMSLQGSPLGFRTDKDKDGGYPPETVKEVFIEAVLRGARPVGNEFNIIGSRCYLTKEHYERTVPHLGGLTDLRLRPGVPQTYGGGALVPYVVTWRLNGKPMRLECIQKKLPDGTILDERIPVRVNQGMGTDGILGKATRKALKRVHVLITGSTITDHDDDDQVAIALDAPAQPASRTQQVLDHLAGVKPAAGQGPGTELLRRIQELASELRMTPETLRGFLDRWKVAGPEQLTVMQAEEVVAQLQLARDDEVETAREPGGEG